MPYVNLTLLILIISVVNPVKNLQNVRIIGGDVVVNKTLYGFQAVLNIKINKRTYICGGSLITDKFIVTAAHCLHRKPKPWNIKIGLGKYDISIKENDSLILRAKDYFLHERYNSSTYRNDIALIELVKNVKLTDYIKPVEISEGISCYIGKIATTLGWGLTENNMISNLLRSVNGTVISNSICGREPEYQNLIGEGNICVKYDENKGVCNGDSGGPLIIDNVLVGITSFGTTKGCNSTKPVVFTRISEYLRWIQHKIEGNSTGARNMNLFVFIFALLLQTTFIV